MILAMIHLSIIDHKTWYCESASPLGGGPSMGIIDVPIEPMEGPRGPSGRSIQGFHDHIVRGVLAMVANCL